MVCQISVQIELHIKNRYAIGNIPYLMEYRYFPSIVTAYFTSNCVHIVIFLDNVSLIGVQLVHKHSYPTGADGHGVRLRQFSGD